MQDASKVGADARVVSSTQFKPQGWYLATVPGTVLTTLVNNAVYPEPLYGENMRAIPESLNKTSYWYRAAVNVPTAYKGRHTWLHFGGVNYSAQVWVNGHEAGTMRGAFIRGDFDITTWVKPGSEAVLAVLVSPQPHPGVPHEHTVATGVGANGGESAIDGPTFLSTIGWDWLAAVRDRDTGIFLPVTMDSSGPVILKDPFVTADLSPGYDSADLHIAATLENKSAKPISGVVKGTVQLLNSQDRAITFEKLITIAASGTEMLTLDTKSVPQLRVSAPKLWWPNGYGPQNLYTLTLSFEEGKKTSSSETRQFGIRKIEYQVPDSENLTLVVNGVRVMARGGNWGLDEAMKRVTRERLDAQFHLHALANLNMQIMYGIAGERRLDERELEWLPGYEHSTPVRVGNAASTQLQLDVYGEVLDAAYHAAAHGRTHDDESWSITLMLLEWLEDGWREEDSGIWEMRGPPRHFTYSKTMAWTAFDRAVRLHEEFGRPGPVARWRKLREEIHAEVLTRAWSDKKQAFAQSFGSDELDASVLRMPSFGFIPATDERFVSTVEAIRRELTVDGLVLRYRVSGGGRRGRVAARRGRLPALLLLVGGRACASGEARRGARAFRAPARPAQRRRSLRRGVRPHCKPPAGELPAGVHTPRTREYGARAQRRSPHEAPARGTACPRLTSKRCAGCTTRWPKATSGPHAKCSTRRSNGSGRRGWRQSPAGAPTAG